MRVFFLERLASHEQSTTYPETLPEITE